jgi:hypothetical protein
LKSIIRLISIIFKTFSLKGRGLQNYTKTVFIPLSWIYIHNTDQEIYISEPKEDKRIIVREIPIHRNKQETEEEKPKCVPFQHIEQNIP